ncbi:MAG TPA: nuclear transport factor 2 family protein, partial [Pyrinomonadaceae bacterium]|nr:nuclear transport factor 2 family protein [Pyrinomonadaceae bacterium]
MRKALFVLLFLAALAPIALTQKKKDADREAALRSLVAAERAFAGLSEAKGIKESFVANLADDGILFRPRPVAGKKWMEERPARPGMLTWRPAFADVARADDMGYTTGPWEFRPKSLSEKPVAYGHFVTVWKRQADGLWKVAVDLGIGHPEPPPALASPEVSFAADNWAKKKSGADAEAGSASLLKAEGEFSKSVEAKQTADEFLSHLAADARVYREDDFPAVGREAARALLMKKPGLLTWQPAKAEVSRSGDLGYTYGAYALKAADEKSSEEGNYLRIWKRQADGKWRVVLDLLSPIPPPA